MIPFRRPSTWRKTAVLAALLAAGLTTAACSRDGGDRPPEPGDQAVATVQDRTIWASDVRREAVAQGLIGEGEPLDATSDLFRRVLDEVIDQKLLAGEAQRRRLDSSALAQRRLEATLGQGRGIQATALGLSGQELLVDHLVQHPAEQVRRRVQRLALADQPLRNRLAPHVGGPDGAILHRGHGLVARLRRPVAPVARAGRRRQSGGQKRGQDRRFSPGRGSPEWDQGGAPSKAAESPSR